MNDENISILDEEITIVEYKGKRVLTFSMIDGIHQRTKGTASRNFKEHRARFTEEKHFIHITRESIDEFRPLNLKVPPKGIILLTGSGYLLLAKSLQDDRAWQVQDELIDNYFNAKAAIENQTAPKTLPAPIKPESQIVTTITQMEPGKPAQVATYDGRVIIVPWDDYMEFNEAFMDRSHEHYVKMANFSNALFDKTVTSVSFMKGRKQQVSVAAK